MEKTGSVGNGRRAMQRIQKRPNSMEKVVSMIFPVDQQKMVP